MAILRPDHGSLFCSGSLSSRQAKNFRRLISRAMTGPRKKDGTAVSMPVPRHPGYRWENRVGSLTVMKIPGKRQRVTMRPASVRSQPMSGRKWNAKEKWVKEKQALGEWKSVKTYDASDLEQWLEQSIPAQGWLAEQMGSPGDGVHSLDEQWQRWASVTEPELSRELFEPSVESHKVTVKSWIEKDPSSPLGVWPCAVVREVLEEMGSPDIALGMLIGVYNSRGVHWRGEGGAQERGLAEKYRNWSRQLAFEYPYVANLLEQIATGYDRDAAREDSEAAVHRRLRY